MKTTYMVTMPDHRSGFVNDRSIRRKTVRARFSFYSSASTHGLEGRIMRIRCPISPGGSPRLKQSKQRHVKGVDERVDEVVGADEEDGAEEEGNRRGRGGGANSCRLSPWNLVDPNFRSSSSICLRRRATGSRISTPFQAVLSNRRYRFTYHSNDSAVTCALMPVNPVTSRR